MNNRGKNLPANPTGRQAGRWLCSVLAFSWLQAQGVICSLDFSLLLVTAARLVPPELRTVRGVRSAERPALRKRGEGDEGQGWRCWGQAIPMWDGPASHRIWKGRRRAWESGFPASAHLLGTAKGLSILAGGPEPAEQHGMWAGDVFRGKLCLIPLIP